MVHVRSLESTLPHPKNSTMNRILGTHARNKFSVAGNERNRLAVSLLSVGVSRYVRALAETHEMIRYCSTQDRQMCSNTNHQSTSWTHR